MFVFVDIEVATVLLDGGVAELGLLDANLIAWERLVTEAFIWELRSAHAAPQLINIKNTLTDNVVLLDKLLAALGPRLDLLLNLVSHFLDVLDDVFSGVQDRVEKVLRATEEVTKDVFGSLSKDRVNTHAQLGAGVVSRRGRSRDRERGE